MLNSSDYRICHQCGNTMLPHRGPHNFKYKGKNYTIDDILSYKCTYCDTSVFTDETVLQIGDEILKRRKDEQHD